MIFKSLVIYSILLISVNAIHMFVLTTSARSSLLNYHQKNLEAFQKQSQGEMFFRRIFGILHCSSYFFILGILLKIVMEYPEVSWNP